MDDTTLLRNITEISSSFAADRAARQLRRTLDPRDFSELAAAGLTLVGVPVEDGGLWRDARRSTRPMCEALRVLARGDPAVALVSSMHPAVLSYWLTAPAPGGDGAWRAQRREVFEAATSGAWWGTITSEPGSGGDVMRTRAKATLASAPLDYRLSGQKHFGSGSGVTSFMVTTALPDGETEPDWFFLDMRGVPWDGSSGVTLLAEWDGHGMAATQSHSLAFEGFPATRFAWPGHLREVTRHSGPVIGCLFTSVVLGVVDVALETAATMRGKELAAFEEVEWSRAQSEGWLARQAFDGMLRAVESGADARLDVLEGKTAVAGLAESVLARLCRVIGGGTFSRRSPFGFWFEDVRALGFLRPPWPLAHRQLGELRANER